MKLEEFGAPLPAESPERKYASLHRTIEAGSADDRIWAELVHTCLTLHRPEEALAALGHIDDPMLRERSQKLIASVGVQGQQRVTTADTMTRTATARAMASQHEESIGENIADSFRFLFNDQMPLIVIFATLTFPLVVGLGGFLTQDSHALVFPLIAMIPALSVVGLIGALGRRILLDASRGLDDPPAIPSIGTLVRNAGRFLLDSSILGLIFLGPPILVFNFDAVSVWAGAAALGLGMFLLPMAMAIRQVTDDFRALSPNVLFTAITRAGLRYAAFAGCTAVLFAPAGISAYFSAGSQIYLQVSVVGPLMVAPMFVVARLLGQMLFLERKQLATLLLPREDATPTAPAPQPKAQAAQARAKAKAQQTAQKRRAPLAAPRHPEARRKTPQPKAQPQAQPPKAQPQKPKAQARPQPKSQPAPAPEQDRMRPDALPKAQPLSGSSKKAGAKPAPQKQAAKPQPKKQPAPAPKKATPVATRVDVEEVTSLPERGNGDLPADLAQIPGLCVVSGDDRVRAGASSSHH